MAAEHAPPPSKSLGTEGQTPWAQYHEEKACFPCASAYSRWKNDLAYLDGGLLVGGRSPALCPYNLKRLGVTHILPVMDTYGRPEQFTGFQYFVVDVEDWSECGEAMAGKWDQAFQFIEQAKGERGRVFVHCFAGISRSPAVCTAYLMARRGLSYSEAKRHVRKFRRKANPNAGFVAQLRLLDERLQENTIQNFLEAGGLADQGKGPGAEEQEKGFVLAQGGVAEEGDGGREGVARQRQKQGLLFRPSAGSNGNGSGEEGNGKGNGNGNGTGEEGNGNGEEGAVLDGRQGRAIGDRMKSGREELKEPGTKYEEALEEATVERGVTTPVSPAKRELGQMTGRNGWSSSVKLACRFTGQAVPTGLAGPVGVPALEPTESTEPPESGESQNSLRQRNGVGLDESAGDRCFAEENEVLIGDEWDAMLRTAERRGCAKKLFGAREEGRGETGREEHVSALLVSPYVGLKALQSQQPAKLGSPFAKGNEEQQNKELSLGDGSSFPPAQAKRSRMKNGSGCHSSATKNYFGLASSAPRSDVEDVVEKRIDGNGTRVHFGVGTGGQDRSGLEVCPADDARALSPAELDRNKRESADRDTERGTGAARFALLEGFAWELATMDWLAGVCFRALGMAKTQSRALA